MPVTAEQCWDAIFRLGADDLNSDVPPTIAAQLMAFKMATLDSNGVLQLTPYGQKCFVVLVSGEGSVLELDALAARENRSR